MPRNPFAPRSRGGLLERFGGRQGVSDMMLGAGMGLLSQGPSLTPQSPWQGLGAGLMLGRQMTADRRQAALEDEKLAMQRDKWAAEKAAAKAAAKQSAAQRTAFEDLVYGLPADVTARAGGAAALVGLGPEQGMAVLAPYLKPESDPLERFHAWRNMPPEKKAEFAEYVEATKTPGVEIVMPGEAALKSRPLRPEEYGQLPEGADPNDYFVEEGRIKPRVMTDAQQQRRRREEAMESGANVFSAYEDAFKAYQSQPNPTDVSRDEAALAKEGLIAWVAKNILGTPNAEPGPAQYEMARHLVPDFSGGWDAPRFAKRVEALRKQAEARGLKFPGPGDDTDTDGTDTKRSESDILKQYGVE